jgi:hypothetical protein
MAAQATHHHARSGRFIKVYLLTWGLLAAAGLTYLASLAWFPDMLTPARQQQQQAEQDRGLIAARQALAEVGSVRRSVVEMQRDLGRLKEVVEEHETHERAAQSRLTALEERVTTMAATPAAPQPAPAFVVPVKPKPAKAQKAAEPQAPTRIISVAEAPKAEPAPAADTESSAHRPEAPKIETGSIAAPPAPITFGAAEVKPSTPARSVYAVQLAASSSLEALRLSWTMLVDRHGATLSSLQPRFVAPKSEGGPYRLVAGPLPSKADADKVCADMRVDRKGCFSTTYIGEPL